MYSTTLAFAVTALSADLAWGTQVQCSSNSAMFKGCYLQEFSNEWISVACADGYTLTSSGECVGPCPAGQYLFGSSCVSCASNCDSCFGPHAFQCSTCSADFELNSQNTCSRVCARSDQYGLPMSESCLDCDATCGTCFNAGETFCTACPTSATATYSLRTLPFSQNRTDAGYCLKDAGIGFTNFYRQYPADKLVIECPDGCQKCLDRYTCTECKTGYNMHPPPVYGAQYSLCFPTGVSR